jgi:hypothetical protein
MKVQAITTFERKTGRRASTKQWPQWYHLDIFRHLEFISYHSTVLICTHLYSTYSTFVCRFGATTNKSQSTARRQEDQLVATLEVRATLYLTQLYDTLRHLTKVLYKSTLQVLCWSVWSVLVRFGPIWSDLVRFGPSGLFVFKRLQVLHCVQPLPIYTTACLPYQGKCQPQNYPGQSESWLHFASAASC